MSAGRRWPRLWIAAGAAAALAASSGLALADTPAAPDAGAWVANGRVDAVAHAADRTYIGGEFTRVGRRSGPGVGIFQPGQPGAGGPNTDLPEVAGDAKNSIPAEIRAVASDGAGGWFIGGDFAYVGGVPRNRLAHILADGTLDSWSPNPNGTVRALALGVVGSTKTLYAGGSFTNIASATRNNLAAFDASLSSSTGALASGALLSWAPDAADWVHAIAVTTVKVDVKQTPTATVPVRTEMPLVVVGGDFKKVGNPAPTSDTTRLSLVWGPGAVDKDNVSRAGQNAGNWNPSGDATATIRAVTLGPSVDKNTTTTPILRKTYIPLYAGGDITSVLAYRIEVTVGRDQPTAIEATSGTVGVASYPTASWKPAVACAAATSPAVPLCTTPAVRSLALRYTPGTGTTIVYVGGEFDRIAGQPRTRLAALDGVPDKAVPDSSCTSPNTCPANVMAFTANAEGGTVRALKLSADSSTLYAGGDFERIGGQPLLRLAAVDPATGTVNGAWNPDLAGGGVNALAVTDATAPAGVTRAVYAGGSFTAANSVARKRIAALDSTGALDRDWDPDADAPVRALAVSGGRVYAGGTFTQIGGAARTRLAALDAGGTGRAIGAFAADAVCTAPAAPAVPVCTAPGVLALAATDTTLYVGGQFDRIAGQPRAFAAALDAGTGTPTGWDPGADGNVYALSASCDTIYAGGSFGRIGGQPRGRIAELDPVTGAATAWNPGENTLGAVFALARAGDKVYAGGSFSLIGGAARGRIAALDAATGKATSWNPSADYAVRAVAVSPDQATVYAGGSFNRIGDADRKGIAALDAATGRATAWDPGASNPTGNPPPPAPVRALALSGSNHVAAGDFTQVATQMQQGFAAFFGGESSDEPVSCRAPAPAAPVSASAEVSAPPLPPPPPLTGLAVRDITAPLISAFTLTSKRFRVAKEPTATVAAAGGKGRKGRAKVRRKRRAKVAAGTVFQYALSEPGRVTISIERRLAGRRVGKGCFRDTARLHNRKRCALYRRAGTLQRTAVKGANATGFSGRVGSRALKPGLYRATIVATDAAGNASKARRVAFEVAPGSSR